MRLVLATEDEAMAWRIWGFSFSRLKGFDFDFLLVLSDLDFFVGFVVAAKLDPGLEVDNASNVGLAGEFSDPNEPPSLGPGSSSLPNGSSLASRSVS